VVTKSIKQRKKRVDLTNAQKEEARLEYIMAEGKIGIVTKLADKYQVTRKTMSSIINKTRKLQVVTNEIEKKKVELQNLNYKIDTYKERANLIKLLESTDIIPIVKKLKNKVTISDKERSQLKSAIHTLESLFRSIDYLHKNDIHYHVDKIVSVIQNMDQEMGNILIPELKKILCDECPIYIKYQKIITQELMNHTTTIGM
jgi:hypothetical protein